MWDRDDTDAGSCDEAMKGRGVTYENKILTTGNGHNLFYKPADAWVSPLVAFAKGG